ncbi:hypothetical protein [Pelagibacterium sp.]|uniref:hypothetical protein n=1 Tax=Pelagibacterium sp. TaxID=1967288 RepID=UPI003BAB6E24
MTEDENEQLDDELPPTSIPAFSINISGNFSSEEEATEFGSRLSALLRTLSRYIDMSDLDGVTVSADYAAAQANLDRGLETTRALASSTPEEDGVIGVAMAPSVVRDGRLKTHLLFSQWAIIDIVKDDDSDELWQRALHTIAHECAHIEVTSAFEKAIPGVKLRVPITDCLKARRWEVIDATWDEYAASRLSAGFGFNPLEANLQVFTASAETARDQANDAILEYRLHGDLDVVIVAVIKAYGNLLKFSAYLLGTLDGQGLDIEEQESLSFLQGHWFEPYFNRLHDVLLTVAKRFGGWDSVDEFEPIADVFVDVLEENGFFMGPRSDGGIEIEIPYRPENTPYHPLFYPVGRRD